MWPYVWQGPYARMRSAHHADHDPGLCADVRAAWMAAGERLIVRSSEIIADPAAFLYDDHLPPAEPEDRGGRYKHIPFHWDASGAPRRLFVDGIVPGQGRFKLDLRAEEEFVDISLSVRNGRTVSMGPMEWHFCVVGYDCPSLADPQLERTYLFDGQRLRTLRELGGSNRTEMYVIAGVNGFVPGIHLTFPKGPVEAQASVIIVEDIAGRHCAALGFDHSYNLFSNSGNCCFHADPYFGTLAPGAECRRHGRLYLVEGKAAAAFRRYRDDFPDQPGI